MNDNTYFITINNIKYKFELKNGILQFCSDGTQSSTSKYKGDYDKAIKETIITGIEFGNGGILSREADYSNSYDNYLVLRGCLWSTKKFSYNSIVRHDSSVKSYITEADGDFENILDSSISKIERNKYAQWNYKSN